MFNQQETSVVKGGSSETYTQSSSKVQGHKGKDQEEEPTRDSAKPAHIVSYTPSFIAWFVGFTEGDGSFEVDYQTNRVSFTITQKDPKVLYFIKKKIGFGKVYLCKDTYYRYMVSNRQNLTYLIGIFSGQLRLAKTKEIFQD